MSLIVSVYVNEGIVMASDSRTTLEVSNQIIGGIEKQSFPISDSTYKTFLCPNGCGISTCGDASFSGQAIASYIERLNESVINKNTSVLEMPQIILDYFNGIDKNKETIFHICGYTKDDNGKELQKIYRVYTGLNARIVDENQRQTQGAIWDGQREIMTRLIKRQIVNPSIIEANNVDITDSDGTVTHIDQAVIIDRNGMMILPEADLAWEFMSLQDAVDFAKFAIETTIAAMNFKKVGKTVGGPIDILIIKPKGSGWLKHKKLSA